MNYNISLILSSIFPSLSRRFLEIEALSVTSMYNDDATGRTALARDFGRATSPVLSPLRFPLFFPFLFSSLRFSFLYILISRCKIGPLPSWHSQLSLTINTNIAPEPIYPRIFRKKPRPIDEAVIHDAILSKALYVIPDTIRTLL